jgi:hypothetical protein
MYPLHDPAQTRHQADADLAASAALLADLRRDFPAFRISHEITGDRIHYIARRRDPATHPHTVVAQEPAAIRSALASSTHQPAGLPGRSGTTPMTGSARPSWTNVIANTGPAGPA